MRYLDNTGGLMKHANDNNNGYNALRALAGLHKADFSKSRPSEHTEKSPTHTISLCKSGTFLHKKTRSGGGGVRLEFIEHTPITLRQSKRFRVKKFIRRLLRLLGA